MPERKGGLGTKIDEYRDDPEAFVDALRFEGDRLVCQEGPDGFTMMTEKKRTPAGRYRFLTRRSVPTSAALIIAEDFEEKGGEVQWK